MIHKGVEPLSKYISLVLQKEEAALKRKSEYDTDGMSSKNQVSTSQSFFAIAIGRHDTRPSDTKPTDAQHNMRFTYCAERRYAECRGVDTVQISEIS